LTAATRKNAQRNRDTVFVESGELLGTEEFPSQQYIMRIRAPKCAAAATPGSFVHISCDDELPMRRPMSIMRASDDWIEILYKVVGEGSRLLASRKAGDTINVLGPIGRPFAPAPERPNCLSTIHSGKRSQSLAPRFRFLSNYSHPLWRHPGSMTTSTARCRCSKAGAYRIALLASPN